MPYFELHCKSNFSFLRGASHADELAARAVQLQYAGLAVTDRNTLAGVVRAHAAAKESGLKLIVGAELVPVDAPPVVVWVTDRAAYGRLSRLITVGRRRAEKGECQLTLDDIAAHAEGLLAGVVPHAEQGESCGLHATSRIQHPPSNIVHPTSCILHPSGLERFSDGRSDLARQDPPLPPLTKKGKHAAVRYSDMKNSLETDAAVTASAAPEATQHFASYREIFGDRAYLLAELHRGADDRRRLAELVELSGRSELPLVAAGDVHYHVAARMALHDVLTAIRHGTTVDQCGSWRFANAERHLRELDEITKLFAEVPDAVSRTGEIGRQCRFSLDELRYEYPEELAPRGQTPMEYLARLTWQGAHQRWPQGVPDKVRRQLKHELQLIEELRYEAYFLTVWDLVRFARDRDILCQGRGSAANSAVCYCLGVTAVDPDQTDLLFERFVSRERDEAPDIDVDFEHERREEVLQYLYEKYGRERAGMTAEVIRYRPRSAVRDVGKALGLSLDRVDALAKNLEDYQHEVDLPDRCGQVGIDPESEIGRRLIYLVDQLLGFPRHLSQHVGGMVMTQGPLCELVPIENAAMQDRTVIQWDKNDLDELGILKVDCLSLGMLTAIRKCFHLVARHTGRQLSLADIPEGDPAVYEMISSADTIGVFQIESRAQMSMLPRLRPQCFYDLVIEVAIVRPGPIQGDMVHPYLRRRAGEEEVTYPNEEIRQVLEKTLGVPIFQEQAMRLAVVAAGFTPGEADQLRRAMGAWRKPGVIDRFRRQLLDGMRQRGLSEKFADGVFRQIRGFGEYGFPESHAASFALLVYVSAWLKYYHPAAFTAAIINSQPMGFYAPAQLVRDARDHQVTVLPADVNHSCWDCTLESAKGETADRETADGETADGERQDQLALRLGLRMIHGFSPVPAEVIERARGAGRFATVEQFTRRTALSRAVVKRLAEANAFGSLTRDRRAALWEALAQPQNATPLPLLDHLPSEPETCDQLPVMELQEEVFADYGTTGLSLRQHPLAFYREQLDELHITPAANLTGIGHGRPVRVAGLVLLRQRPSTAKGITFVTLEDETGTANLVIHQQTWDRFYAVARHATVWIAHGRLECKDQVIHVVVRSLEDLTDRLRGLRSNSRDFR